MTLKAAMDDAGGVSAETITDRLKAVQRESWRKLEYVHDESDAAWATYNKCLLLKSGQPGGPQADDKKGKGKVPATGEDPNDDSGSPELVERVPHLRTNWDEDDLLRAMAGIGKHDKKPGEEAIAPTQSQAALAAKMEAASKGKGKAPATTSSATAVEPKPEPVSPVAKKRGRPAKRGGRGSTAAAGDAMQID